VIGRARPLVELSGGPRRLLISLAISLAQTALLVPVPLIIRHVFETDLPRGDSGGVVVDGAIVLALYLASSAFGLWGRWTVLVITKRAVAELRRSLVVKLYALPRSFHDRTDSGVLHATVVQDSERLDVVASVGLGQVLPAAVVATGLGVVALVINPLLCAVLACAVPAMVAVKRRLGAELRRRTRAWQEAFDRFSGGIHLGLRAHAMTEARGAAGLEVDRLSASAQALSDAGLRMAWRQSALSASQGAISSVAAVLVLVVGGTEVASHSISLASLISFYAIVALLQGQVSTVVGMLPLVISGGESLDRLTALLDVDEPPAYRGTARIDFRGGVELRDVTFG
jgi:ABC-type multidrug transport system fused ATPase/permease subunit